MPQVPELELAVSATTRARREGEQEGREYYFVTDEAFRRRLEAGEFLEYVDFEWGQRVGTLWSEIDRIRGRGKAPLLDLEERFDHVVVNDELDRAVGEVEAIVRRALDGAGTMARR